METVGVRELRQRTSEIIRRVEEGETFVITVAGREVAELHPGQPRRTWRNWDDITEIFLLPPDPALMDQLEGLGWELADPWSGE